MSAIFWIIIGIAAGILVAKSLLGGQTGGRKRPGGNSNVQPAPTAPAAGGGVNWKDYLPKPVVLWWVAGAIVLVAIVTMVGPQLVATIGPAAGAAKGVASSNFLSETFSGLSKLPTSVLWSGIAVIVLAILGEKKAGKAGKWARYLLAGTATAYIVWQASTDIYYKNQYGPQADAVKEAQHKLEAAEEIAELNEDSAASGSWVGRKTAITLTPEWSKAVRVTGGECIRWWGSDPDGNSFLVQVRGVNDNAWYEWEEWKRLRSGGQITHNFGWVRFKATGAVAVVTYEFRQVGQCS